MAKKQGDLKMSDEKKGVVVKESDRPHKKEQQRQLSPFEAMEHMIEDVFDRNFFMPSWMRRPRLSEMTVVSSSLDMFEDGDDLVIKADIPGMKKEDINIDFTGDLITISGEKKTEERTEQKDYYRLERSFGSFSRKLRLPIEIQIDKTQASFKDGVLEIRMPKSEKEKQKVRKIQVK
jgi:HSP20 family protein